VPKTDAEIAIAASAALISRLPLVAWLCRDEEGRYYLGG
jgi:hypothetical protein